MLIVPSRRKFITGLVSLITAPAIVRVQNIMPVRAYYPQILTVTPRFSEMYLGMMISINDELYKITGLSTIEKLDDNTRTTSS